MYTDAAFFQGKAVSVLELDSAHRYFGSIHAVSYGL